MPKTVQIIQTDLSQLAQLTFIMKGNLVKNTNTELYTSYMVAWAS